MKNSSTRTFRLPTDLMDALRADAERTGETINGVAVRAIRTGLAAEAILLAGAQRSAVCQANGGSFRHITKTLAKPLSPSPNTPRETKR